MLFAIAIVISLFFLVQISCLFWVLAEVENGKLQWLFKKKRQQEQERESWPKVSLLLAARNEEELITRSLESIAALDYPQEKLQILIGDDDSSDRTKEIVEDFIRDNDNFNLLEVKENLGKARGKANVLAHLAHEANGEFYFITDVDVKLPATWIKGMLQDLSEDVGIASGISMCERGNLFASLQSIDLASFYGLYQSFC